MSPRHTHVQETLQIEWSIRKLAIYELHQRQQLRKPTKGSKDTRLQQNQAEHSTSVKYWFLPHFKKTWFTLHIANFKAVSVAREVGRSLS